MALFPSSQKLYLKTDHAVLLMSFLCGVGLLVQLQLCAFILESFFYHVILFAFRCLPSINLLIVNLFNCCLFLDASLLLYPQSVSALQSTIPTRFCPLQHTAKPTIATAWTADRFVELFQHFIRTPRMCFLLVLLFKLILLYNFK